MEFCSGGSCGDLMKPGLIGEDYISIIIRELLLGLDYLHGDKKLHRDIKGNESMFALLEVLLANGLQLPTFSWDPMDKLSWRILVSRDSSQPP
jgi:serine/threonine protein kinase